MSRGSLRGRADLLRCWSGIDEADAEARAERERLLAQALGYGRRSEKPFVTRKGGQGADGVAGAGAQPAIRIEQAPLRPTPFWAPSGYKPIAREIEDPPLTLAPVREWLGPTEPPRWKVIAPWRALEPVLRRLLAPLGAGRDLDVPAAVGVIARGGGLDALPRKQRRLWARRVHLILDRSPHLAPYIADQEDLVHRLRSHLPNCAVEICVFDEADRVFRPPLAHAAGDALLVLGDLGSLAGTDRPVLEFWSEFGTRIVEGGGRPAVLTPGPAGLIDPLLARLFDIVPWDSAAARSTLSRAERGRLAQRLLRLASPATRIEAGMLRALRLEFMPECDAGIEAEIWNRPEVERRSTDAIALSGQDRARLRAAFEADGRTATQEEMAKRQADREKALAIMRDWRYAMPREIWFEEVLSLTPRSRRLLPPQDEAAALAFFEGLDHRRRVPGADPITPGLRAWIARAGDRVGVEGWSNKAFNRLAWSIKKAEPDFAPPVRPEASGDETGPLLWVGLAQSAGQLAFSHDTAATENASPLVRLPSSDGVFEIDSVGADLVDNDPAFWEGGVAPDWATGWGVDKFGAWAAFALVDEGEDRMEVVTQRLRWIPPGRFQMGSPETEAGRDDDEGPQHDVTFRQGFWLFDTPVTQALWQAIMEDNPSEFKSADRPVETVSFEDAGRFLARINQEVPGLDLALPSEAQWEYACRAGTDASTYAGEMQILGPNNAPVLDSIAWYGGNSGVEYDLPDGRDSSDWPEKQYDHDKAGTHPVGLKQSNAWGLHDMLGNVWEWCADTWHDDYEGAPTDGSAWIGTESGTRVVRGGSWGFEARNVRSAYRDRVVPTYRNVFLGFRCARGQGERSDRRAVPAWGGRSRTEQGLPAAPETVRVSPGRKAEASIPKAPAFRVLSDHAEVTVSRIFRPHWAEEIGRDRFGLFVTVAFQDVLQKLRWIPPGSFKLGSPEDEAGRFDREGSQHDVTLATGFWLFDSPVRQALWQAVMGDNPSAYQSPDRPVETVGFEEVTRFLTRVNEERQGLDLVLPSEAQWEYACRAGSEASTYAGEMEILGMNNAPVLDSIAWYGGNSGVGFELSKGHDSSGWKEKQYDHVKAGTRPVGLKQPNAWGLHDMLGNVFEWCADTWHEDYKGAPADGSAWIDESGVSRVVRGGSWYDEARVVRSAYRNHYDPTSRNGSLGFRCARGPA